MSENTPGAGGLGAQDESMLGADPLRTAQELSDALQGMTRALGRVQATIRRGKVIVIALALVIVAVAGLGAGVAVLAVQAGDASAQAKANVGQLCQAGNVSRGEAYGNWVYALDHLGLGATPAGRKFEADFEAHLRKVYAPRDCSRLAPVSRHG